MATKGRIAGTGQRVALVSPEFPHSGRVPMVPPILEYLGALTLREQPDAALHLVDANVTPIRPEHLPDTVTSPRPMGESDLDVDADRLQDGVLQVGRRRFKRIRVAS
jgi:hypothetical protein